jgi:anti-anti-sigma factor
MDTVVEITHREVEGCAVLDIKAENFTYPQTVALKNYVGHLLEAGHKNFIYNCAGIGLVDSYGLATIISTLKMIKERGGALALYSLNDMFSRLVEVTHLDRALEIWPSEAQAIYYISSTQAKGTAKH